MKASLTILLFGCTLVFAACVPATTAGAPAALPQATVTQPAPETPDVATPVPTETAAPTETVALVETAAPTETAEPTATALPSDTPTAEAAEATPSPVAESGETEPAAASPDEPMAVDTALLELGKEVYHQQACGVCHSLASAETLGTFGPPHNNLAMAATERIGEERYKGTATTAEEYIRESIVNPQAFMVTGYQITRFPMPIFTNLSEQEVDALVYLLMQPPATTTP
jgi:cytochrome c551/c552